MYTEHSAIHDRTESKIVENLAAISPYIGRPILPLTLIVEAVHLRDLPRLVVPSDQGNAIGIADFVCEKKKERFYRVETSVDEVAHEEVVRVRTEPSDLEKLHHIPELAMDVTAYL